MLRPFNLELDLKLDNKEVPMYQQLAEGVQKLIVSGTLKPGDALPGSREMAAQLHVSRKTVVSAMELLVFSGWLENRERVGLFVNTKLPSEHNAQKGKLSTENANKKPVTVESEEKKNRLVINDGFPDTQLTPYEALSRSYRQFFNRAARWKMLGYNDPRGSLKFRRSLAQEICQERGLPINEDEVMVTRGSQMALFLSAHVMIKPGKAVAIEDPTYEYARLAAESAGATLYPIPVDEEGLQVDVLENTLEEHPEISLLYVTPRFQYPTTVTLSPARRRRLVDVVIKHNLFVVEDDFGHNFHFNSKHQLPLCVMLPKSNCLYIATYSKTLAPALRMGFVTSSVEVINQLANYRKLIDMQGDEVMERSIVELYENGEIKRHIRRARKVYQERLDYISNLIHSKLNDKVNYKRPDGGLALWMTMEKDPRLELALRGIKAPVFALADGRFGIRVGYASMQNEEMDLFINVLSDILRDSKK